MVNHPNRGKRPKPMRKFKHTVTHDAPGVYGVHRELIAATDTPVKVAHIDAVCWSLNDGDNARNDPTFQRAAEVMAYKIAALLDAAEIGRA